jgi:hypothetical protein
VSDPDWRLHCADLAVAHVKAVTGRDVWKELGGRPGTPRQAANVLKKLKVRTYRQAVSKVLGKAVNPKKAMRGDLVMVDNALGICRGDLVECMDRMNPISRATAAWHLKRSE